MTILALESNASGTGSLTLAAPNISSAQTINFVDSSGTLSPMITNTAVTPLTTYVDYAVPSWVKKITVGVYGLSGSSTSSFVVRLGTASGILATGYFTGMSYQQGTTTSTAFNTTGLYIGTPTAASVMYGAGTLMNISGGKWVWSGSFVRDDTTTDIVHSVSGGIDTVDPVTTVRITSFTPDTFDAGTVNVIFE